MPQERDRDQSASGRVGHIQERGTAAARGTARSPRGDPSGVLRGQRAQRRGGDHVVRDGDGERLHTTGVHAVAGRVLDRVPRVRMGHGELRAAALSGGAQEGGRAAVGPGTVRAASKDHAARRQVSAARGFLVRGRRGA